jgi:hypothetical protein
VASLDLTCGKLRKEGASSCLGSCTNAGFTLRFWEAAKKRLFGMGLSRFLSFLRSQERFQIMWLRWFGPVPKCGGSELKPLSC